MGSPTDWLVLGLATLGLGGLVVATEWMYRVAEGGGASRRLGHVAVCTFVAASPWLFSGPTPICLLSGAFVLINGAAWWNGWWPGLHGARPESWGTVAVPLAVLPAAAATWAVADERVLAFQAAFLVLGVADPLASWLGERFETPRWVGRATWAGTGAFLIVAWGILGAVLLGAGLPLGRAMVGAGGGALVGAVTEAISTRGSDNLFVVLGVILCLLLLGEAGGGLYVLWGSLVVGGGVGGAAAYWGLLTRRGSGAAGLFAAALVGLGGVNWAVPGIVFFGLSSALSFLPSLEQRVRPPRRTIRQVLANGGVAWTLLVVGTLVAPHAEAAPTLCYAGFVGALAAAAADTWATELGVRGGRRPLSLRTFRFVAPGTSGAISLRGTLAGAVGAGTVVGSAGAVAGLGAPEAGWMLAGGLAGMVADSLLGATVQAHGKSEDGGGWNELTAPAAEPARGVSFVDNDVVNLIGTVAGAVVAIGGRAVVGG
ncbi:MAG: DUF92 domain-containing protein [Salinibacter sp.]